MAIQVATPCVEIDSVVAALESMRQGRRLETTHPLTQFISIHQNTTATLEGLVAAEVRIFRHLARHIQRQLNRHRENHSLAPIAAAEVRVREDFEVGSAELEAWSTLYYRYVRIDLDWSVERLAHEVGQPERTLRRRQQLGLYRLTQRLARREMRTREQENIVLMHTNLPPIRPPFLIDRDEVLNWGWNRLTNIGTEPHHILLNGASGIGKSVIAHRLARDLIDNRHVRSLVWIEKPDIVYSILCEHIVQELGLPLVRDARATLRSYYRQSEGLVVIDNAHEIVADEHVVQSLLNVLEDAHVILCARISPRVLPSIPTYDLTEFDDSLVQEFFDQLATTYPNRLPNEERLKQIYEQVGGNPRALWAAIDAGQPTASIAQSHYSDVWTRSLGEQRSLWTFLALSCEQTISTIQVGFIEENESNDVDDSIEALLRLHVAEQKSTNQIGLVPLARTFVENVLSQELVDSSVTMGIKLTLALPSQYWMRSPLSHLLSTLARLKVSASQHIYMATTFGIWALAVGATEAWLRYYEMFQTQIPELDRVLCLRLVGEAHAKLGEWTESAYALTDAIEQAGSTGDFDEQAKAHLSLANVLSQRGNSAAARTLLLRAEEYFRRQDAIDELQRVQFSLAQLESAASSDLPDQDMRRLFLEIRSEIAGGEFARALDIALRVKSDLMESDSNYPRLIALMGRIYFALGDWARAVDAMRWSIRAFEVREEIAAEQQARINLAQMYVQHGNAQYALGELDNLPAWVWDE
ncbi:MAG: hypothetical protein KF726_00175 [Anaerolineae bacterium]|nr:hypothetical protein [Anaerolineae bacterium]